MDAKCRRRRRTINEKRQSNGGERGQLMTCVRASKKVN